MTRFAALIFLPALVWSQDLATRGAEVYNKTCATGYCHGLKGVQGGAPRLAGRDFSEAYIAQAVRAGIAGTAMPSFGATLPNADLSAVVAYVASLNGVAPARNPVAEKGPASRTLSPDAARGRGLFFDASRAFGRCSTCHQADGMGLAVAGSISKPAESVDAMRQLPTTRVLTATSEGETFPALVVSKGGVLTKVYDLTVSPPVLRTFPAEALSLREGSSWQHAIVLASYSDADLEAILAFLRATIHP
jgi:mono/diheme cytochrome c family protein